tara:strand:+ start:292 stop:681 length:390 start_codon:yes stop_codon:yes gene_type:complete
MSYSDNYSSSIELDTEFSMFDTEMVGGKSSISTQDLKQVVILTTKIIANCVKRYHKKHFFTPFNSEKYNKTIGKILQGGNLNEPNTREQLKKILSLNTSTIVELKNLLLTANKNISGDLKLLSNILKKL